MDDRVTSEKAIDFLCRLGYIFLRFCSILYSKRELAIRAVLRVFPGSENLGAMLFFAGKVTKAIIS
jgi:hypothetical protein